MNINLQPGFLVLASDGIWDVANNSSIAHAVHKQKQKSPKEIADNLVFSAEAAGSQDNMTALVIRVPGKKSEDPESKSEF